MRASQILSIIAISLLTIASWHLLNRPSDAPDWPTLPAVNSVSFSPYQKGQDPWENNTLTADQIRSDIDLLTTATDHLRTYTVAGIQGEIPAIADEYNMDVTLGAWLSDQEAVNAAEVERAIAIAIANPNVKRLVIGNETILRKEQTAEQVMAYMDQARKAFKKAKRKVAVSTAETWDIWVAKPELAKHADFIAAHILPFWEGIAIDNALNFIDARHADLTAAFGKMPIMIAEVGWPSQGRTIQQAEATPPLQAQFLRQFVDHAERKGYDYSLMEAFDQPWKAVLEGSVGAYWGVYDVERQPKFAFTGEVMTLPEWSTLAAITAAIALIINMALFKDGQQLGRRGLVFLSLIAHVSTAGAVWITYNWLSMYLTPLSLVVGVVLFISFLVLTVVLFTEAHEMAEANWAKARRRPLVVARPETAGYTPKVSIHVPAYNEPADMVIETLNALARLDYPNFEVLMIDNNTKDEAVWRPVEEHCKLLGERFKFFHVAPLAGYKAGALNYTMKHTAPDAEIIAVIDSDYIVTPDWLKDLAPQFYRPEVAIVQAPQDYRDEHENAFKAMCYAEYKGFFHIGMVTRNERNAIIQHGTMTMIRTRVLKEVGGWAEWCITEDAELGLSVFEKGWEALYVERSYGKGLMPDTFIDFKKQRSRWAFGAIQIMRRHLGELLGFKSSGLTWGQRYHFVSGWLPWIADGVNLAFTLGAVLWSVGMLAAPRTFEAPLAIYALPPFALFVFKILKLLVLYRTRVNVSLAGAIGAAVSGLALSHTIAKAVLTGFVVKGRPFFRTPKCENKPLLLQALLAVQEEAAILLTLLSLAVAVWVANADGIFEAKVWSLMLVMMSLPQLAAVGMSLVNVWPKKPSAEDTLGGLPTHQMAPGE